LSDTYSYNNSYRPAWFLRNGHVNTIYPTFFRKNPILPFVRHRLITDDNDFLDIDLLSNDNSQLAILCHGLEGSSQSKYMLGTAAHLYSHGWDIAAVNYRGCSGEMNRQKILYNSGATYDLDRIVREYVDQYDELVLVGFSLGGNLVLKYMGDGLYSNADRIKACVSVSVPVDLKAGCLTISKPSNFIYEYKFLKSLKEKVRLKSVQYPKAYNLNALDSVKTLYDFDNTYTGPIHGYRDAYDYYAKCSARPFLKNVIKPTLIINALDDPFLPEACYPYKEINENENLSGLFPNYGGHVGFVNLDKATYWEEDQILKFIDSV
jgi:predicted alpha/beta-fold hydrolase